MSCPPLPETTDDLLDPNGDYIEVPFSKLPFGVFIFYIPLVNEMFCVNIFDVYREDGDVVEIDYRIINEFGNEQMNRYFIDIDDWNSSQYKAFRFKTETTLPPPARPSRLERAPTSRGGTKRKRKNKKSNKYKKTKKSRKTRK